MTTRPQVQSTLNTWQTNHAACALLADRIRVRELPGLDPSGSRHGRYAVLLLVPTTSGYLHDVSQNKSLSCLYLPAFPTPNTATEAGRGPVGCCTDTPLIAGTGVPRVSPKDAIPDRVDRSQREVRVVRHTLEVP